MEFQREELAGASCVHSGRRILVATDGANCAKCGRAVLRAHQSEHEQGCSGEGAIRLIARDYDEQPEVVWTGRLIGAVSAGVFIAALGGGLMMATPEVPAGESPRPMPTIKLAAGFGLMALGAAAGAFSFDRERRRQAGSLR
jgi:hypothetical protein